MKDGNNAKSGNLGANRGEASIKANKARKSSARGQNGQDWDRLEWELIEWEPLPPEPWDDLDVSWDDITLPDWDPLPTEQGDELEGNEPRANQEENNG